MSGEKNFDKAKAEAFAVSTCSESAGKYSAHERNNVDEELVKIGYEDGELKIYKQFGQRCGNGGYKGNTPIGYDCGKYCLTPKKDCKCKGESTVLHVREQNTGLNFDRTVPLCNE